MATVVLQVAGAAIGAAIGGPVGATIGRAVGAAAGYAIDQKIFNKDRFIAGGRLDNVQFLGAGEGTAVPRIYGRVKLGGQLIWTTRFEEVRQVKKSGGKGGPTVRTESFTYFANFAVGICEGPISRIGRIWVDGKEIDRTQFQIRLYKGSKTQAADPLIEAKQGAGNAPAYRGTAYAVFDKFPLADFGNRIPQITFEVTRSISKVDKAIRAVSVIPGASEFAYDPRHIRITSHGVTTSQNRHTLVAGSDWRASIDELQDLCPNLKSVSLIVAWFGTDLRAGNCAIEPRVEYKDPGRPGWNVSGLSRSQANLTSRIDGKPAYGGTPTDESIIEAINDLKARGLKVVLYPFIMMDIAEGNGLADPYGRPEQSPFPWRGRITCHPAAGQPGTVDKTAQATSQIAAFCGNASAADFASSGKTVTYTGPAEWSLRRMVLHYTHLAQLAGSVDAILIGSELRGLTRVRNENDEFPFVDQLRDLAAEVRSICGAGTAISYAADWSEYFGYQPADASGDAWYNLDPLWADANIDAVAIDNYMPLTDWHETGDPGQPDQASGHSVDYLQSNILGGEGYDWYYASNTDRKNGSRTPITDGAGEPWVWRYKDILSWWSNPHHERIGGNRSAQPTAWQSMSKPVWFTEAGCPAVNRGANQPNVFYDEKSSESALPYFSNGERDDLIQSRYIEATTRFWEGDQAAFDNPNPVSPVYSGPMVDPDKIWFWTWDARPFPAFPLDADIWSDGANWHRGHWLDGRLGSCPLDDLLTTIFADHEIPLAAAECDGHLQGWVVTGGEPLRNSLEPLMTLFNLSASERNGEVVIRGKNHHPLLSIDAEHLVAGEEGADLKQVRQPEDELPRECLIAHAPVLEEFETAVTASRRLETASDRQISIEVPAVLERQRAKTLAEARLRDLWTGRDTAQFSLPPASLGIEAGDLVRLSNLSGGLMQVRKLTEGLSREVEASGFARFEESTGFLLPAIQSRSLYRPAGKPEVLLMNLPLGQSEYTPMPAIYGAAYASPWHGPYIVEHSPDQAGYVRAGLVSSPATMMQLLSPLPPGPTSRRDWANVLHVALGEGELQSLEDLLLFAGGNALAVKAANGEWEIIQFSNAEIIAEGEWRLTGLLRGQMGTEVETQAGCPSGAPAVLLNEALGRFELADTQVGLPLNWRTMQANATAGPEDIDLQAIACNNICARPLSPVHLRIGSIVNDDYEFEWVRRSRLNSDSWENPEVPLDEPSEMYRVEVLDNGSVAHSIEVTDAEFLFPAATRQAALGSLSNPFAVRVAQVSRTGAAGRVATLAVQP